MPIRRFCILREGHAARSGNQIAFFIVAAVIFVIGGAIFALAKDGRKTWANLSDNDKTATMGGWVVASCLIAFVIYIFIPNPPPASELRRASQQALQREAQECQDLFAYWDAGLITDEQEEQLQECVRKFGNR